MSQLYRWWAGGLWYRYFPKPFPYMTLWTRDPSYIHNHEILEETVDYGLFVPKAAWFFIKGLFNLASIKDGSTCWFSKHFWEIHDYPTKRGGDGTPSHFHVYTCSKCSKYFTI